MFISSGEGLLQRNRWPVQFGLFRFLIIPSKYHGRLKKSGAAAAELLQLCPTLCDPVDSSPPGSSVHGILQAGVLEWVAMPSSGLSS